MPVNDFQLIERTFLSAYRCDAVARVDVQSTFLFGARGAADLFSVCNGATFEGGLYRLHTMEQIPSWTGVACSVFPQFSGRIECFAFDWLGRMFALDAERKVDDQPAVLMLEPGTGQALEIPANFLTFHCDELIQYADAALARNAYEEWCAQLLPPLHHTECVGYKVPLFLGGADDVSNMHRLDMAVYWELCAQFLQQVRPLGDGTAIKGVS